MEPHQQRVVEEKAELDGKARKLRDFMGLGNFIPKPAYVALPDDEKERMTEQLFHMEEYSRVLGERISAFTPAPEAGSDPEGDLDVPLSPRQGDCEGGECEACT